MKSHQFPKLIPLNDCSYDASNVLLLPGGHILVSGRHKSRKGIKLVIINPYTFQFKTALTIGKEEDFFSSNSYEITLCKEDNHPCMLRYPNKQLGRFNQNYVQHCYPFLETETVQIPLSLDIEWKSYIKTHAPKGFLALRDGSVLHLHDQHTLAVYHVKWAVMEDLAAVIQVTAVMNIVTDYCGLKEYSLFKSTFLQAPRMKPVKQLEEALLGCCSLM